MNTKLTLSIDQQLIEKAKRAAKERGTSLSSLVTVYLKTITRAQELESAQEIPMGSTVAALRGSIKLSEPKEPYKQTINKYREEKWEKP